MKSILLLALCASALCFTEVEIQKPNLNLRKYLGLAASYKKQMVYDLNGEIPITNV